MITCKDIFLTNLSTMKGILSLAEFKMGKNTDDYKYFKKEIMDRFYNSLGELFDRYRGEDIIEKCPCGARLRKGYSSCSDCGGSGFKSKKCSKK